MNSLRDFIARFTASSAAVNPKEGEFRRLSQAGDEARRTHQYDAALDSYQRALTVAREANLLKSQEVILGQIGALQTERHQYELAEQALSEAMQLAEKNGDQVRRSRALLNFGAYHLIRGDQSKAQRYLEQSLELARPSGDSMTVALALGNLGDLYLRQNNASYALRLLKEAVSLVPPTQNGDFLSYLIGRLGQAHLGTGESERGRRLLTQAIQLAQGSNQPENELRWTILLADQLFKEGQLAEALKLYQRADTLFAQVGKWPDELSDYGQRSLLNQAAAYQRLADYERALGFANRAIEEARAKYDAVMEGNALSILASVQRGMGKRDEAVVTLKSVVTLFTDKVKNDAERIKAMLALGNLYQELKQPDQAQEIFEAAVDESGADNPGGRARALQQIGIALKDQGNYAKALEKLTEALTLFEKINDANQVARVLCDTGAIRRNLSGINSALPDYERATVTLSNVRDISTRGFVLSNVANLYTDLGEVETAQSFYQESIQLARQSGQRWAESLRLGNFGWFYTVTGQVQEGIRLLEEGIAISRQLDDPLLIAVQTNNLAQAYHEQKDYKTAEGLLGQAITAADTKLNDRRWKSVFQSNLGRTLTAQGRLDEAYALLQESLVTSRELRDQETLSRTLSRIADIQLKRSNLDAADEAASEAENTARKWGYRKGQADALVVRAGVARARNDNSAADNYVREAQKLYSILHDPMATELMRLASVPT